MAMRMASAGMANGGAIASLDAHWAEGSAWVCMGGPPDGCGPQFMLGRSGERGIHLERSPDGAYDGWFGVGAVTASRRRASPEFDAQLAGIASSPSAQRAHARQAWCVRSRE